jgi:hypothetical protein
MKTFERLLLLGLIVGFALLLSCQNPDDKRVIANLFLLANADSSVVFAPSFVSTHLAERDAALSPNRKEFYYTISSYTRPTIAFIKWMDSGWCLPKVASFSGVYSDLEPHFSPDGNRLYFVSNRPLEQGGELKDFDIWYVERTENGWSEPINLGEPVNTPANEFYPSIAKSGTLYWCATRSDGIGGEDIFYSKLVNGQYQAVQALSDSINTESDEYNAFVDPHERYVIFTSHGWGAGQGRGDLWISYRKPDETWTRPVNMGEAVNTPFMEYCPFVSHDGKHLFFTSDRVNQTCIKSPVTYEDIIYFSHQPTNRLSSIYVIEADIIDKLNPLK